MAHFLREGRRSANSLLIMNAVAKLKIKMVSESKSQLKRIGKLPLN